MATPAPEPAPSVYSDGGLPGASAEAAAGASAVGSAATAGTPASPLVSPAAEPTPGVSPDGGLHSASAEAAAGASAVGSAAGAWDAGLAARLLRRRSRYPACPLTGVPSGVSTGAGGAHSPRFCPQPPPIPATAPHYCGCPATRLASRRWTLLLSRSAQPGAAAPLPICSRSTTCCRPPPGRWREPVQLTPSLLCPSQLAPRPWVGCAAGTPHVAPPPRCWRARSTQARRRLAGGRGRAGRPSHLRARSVHLRRRIIRSWPWSPVYEPPASGDRHHRQPSATIRSTAPLARRL